MVKPRQLASGKWQVQIRRAGEKPISKTFRLKDAAEKFIRKMEDCRDNRITFSQAESEDTTLKQAIHAIQDAFKGGDKSFIQRTNFWANELGHLQLTKIQKADIKPVLESLAITRCDATVNRYKAALSSIFTVFCEMNDLDIPNPARSIKAKKETATNDRYLTIDEQERLLAACKQSGWDKLYALVLMALVTGARRGEMFSLTWNKLDLARKRARLSAEHTKNGKPRVLTMSEPLVNELKRIRTELVGEVPDLAKTREIADQPIFEMWNFEHHFYKALEEAGIERCRFHDLRHTCASTLAEDGASLLDIAEKLGHSSVTVTQRYAHLCVDHIAERTERSLGFLS